MSNGKDLTAAEQVTPAHDVTRSDARQLRRSRPGRETMHALRNALGKVTWCADVLSESLDGDLKGVADTIVDAAQRAADMVAELEQLLHDQHLANRHASRANNLSDDGVASASTVATARTVAADSAESAADTQPYSDDLLGPGMPGYGMLDSDLEPAVPSQSGLPSVEHIDVGGVALTPGETVGEYYRVEYEIGRGGMGTVIRAFDTQLRRHAALKFLHIDEWGTEDSRTTFEREARSLARVRHPNVVSIYSFGEHKTRPYFAMEIIEGSTLEELREQSSEPLDIDDVLDIIDQVCRGVEAIHRGGTLHRDIKPSNVLVEDETNRVAVADFSLAGPVKPRAPGAHVSGTPGYAAPEAFQPEMGPLDARADVYAIGLLAYELLTGKRAYPRASVDEMLRAQLLRPVPAVSDARPQFEVFDDVVKRATARSPAERTTSVRALRRELGAARNTLGLDYAGLVVHVVDDDHNSVKRISEVVSRALPGADVASFGDGSEALAAAMQKSPQLVFADLAMPELDGEALTRCLHDGRLVSAPDVVVITGYGGAPEWRRLKRAGASHCLLKPVEPEALTALARRLAAHRKVAPMPA